MDLAVVVKAIDVAPTWTRWWLGSRSAQCRGGCGGRAGVRHGPGCEWGSGQRGAGGGGGWRGTSGGGMKTVEERARGWQGNYSSQG
jgi:hypothetical protein